MKLTQIILEKVDNYTVHQEQADELERELRDTYNRDDINVKIIRHSNGDKAIGKVQVRSREELEPSLYLNMKNTLTAKGFDITGGSNYADDDGDRYYYPDIKFEFAV